MAKKRRHRRRSAEPSRPRLTEEVALGLDEADALVREERWIEAREVLEELDRLYGDRVDVLAELAKVSYELEDMAAYELAIYRLCRLQPHEPAPALALAGANLENLHPAMALRGFRRFLERWPSDEGAAGAREVFADLEAKLPTVLAEVGLLEPGGDLEEALDLGVLHEEAQLQLALGDLRSARQTLDRLLRRRPRFVGGLNNRSMLHYLEGHADQGIVAAREALAVEPENVHALANLARDLYLSGRAEEALATAARLKAVRSDRADRWVKTAETLSFLGDDRGVLEAFAGAEAAGLVDPPLGDPLLHHLAAVAAMRLGREPEARRRWRRALELAPGFELARENLEDLERPVGERHAPWPFGFANWAPARMADELAGLATSLPRDSDDEAVARRMGRFVEQHPVLGHAVAPLLDRGDPAGRELALRLALLVRTPAMVAALRDFALGQRGPDDLRHEAAQAAVGAGALEAGAVRMWMGGAWREVQLVGFEIHDEPVDRLPPRLESLHLEALAALRRGQAALAERLLRRALAARPEEASLLHNLAAACLLQGREREAEEILRRLHERQPDYAFARIGLAGLAAERGNVEEGLALVEPLLSRRRAHSGEFEALCDVEIALQLARGDEAAARRWFELLKSYDPEHPALDRWRGRFGGGPLRWLLGRKR